MSRIRICGDCQNEVMMGALKCRHCGSSLENSEILDENFLAQREFPIELKGVNVGAALLPFFWAVAHGAAAIAWIYFILGILSAVMMIIGSAMAETSEVANLAVLVLFTIAFVIRFVLLIVIPAYLLFAGNRLAWKIRYFKDIEQFRKTQRAWTIAGLVMLALAVCIGLLGILL